jgi:hypothetical protein
LNHNDTGSLVGSKESHSQILLKHPEVAFWRNWSRFRRLKVALDTPEPLESPWNAAIQVVIQG